MKKAFTLLELLIVVIVIAVLATLAIPQYLRAVERGRVAKAKNALRLIDEGMKMRRAEIGTYPAGTADQATLVDDLREYVEVNAVADDRDWNYETAVDQGADTFTITATRIAPAGSYLDQNIIIDQDGGCTGTHDLRGPDCP